MMEYCHYIYSVARNYPISIIIGFSFLAEEVGILVLTQERSLQLMVLGKQHTTLLTLVTLFS